MTNLELTNVDPKLIEEYSNINKEIEKLSDDDHYELKRLLKRRAEILSEIFGRKVYSIFE